MLPNTLNNLSNEQKYDLIDELWVSLADETENEEIPEFHKRILDERMADTGKTMSWDEFKQFLNGLQNRRSGTGTA